MCRTFFCQITQIFKCCACNGIHFTQSRDMFGKNITVLIFTLSSVIRKPQNRLFILPVNVQQGNHINFFKMYGNLTCITDLPCFRQSSPINRNTKVDLRCLLDTRSEMIVELHTWMDTHFSNMRKPGSCGNQSRQHRI